MEHAQWTTPRSVKKKTRCQILQLRLSVEIVTDAQFIISLSLNVVARRAAISQRVGEGVNPEP